MNASVVDCADNLLCVPEGVTCKRINKHMRSSCFPRQTPLCISSLEAWFRQRVRSNPYAFEPLRHSFAVMNWISSAWGYQMIPSWTRACCEWHAEARRQAAFSYVVISKQPSRSRQPPQKGQLLPPGTTTGCQNSSKHAGKGLCQITWGQVHKKA